MIFIILITLIIILFYIYNSASNEENITIQEGIPVIINRFPKREKIKNIIFNKTVIIGDSRMSFIRGKAQELNIPKNFTFIAEGGTKINWFRDVAKPNLEYYLDNIKDDINYHVLINMGVNDLDSYFNPETIADNYFNLYRNLATNYQNIDFYILSVNPIDDSIIYKYFGKNQLRTTKKIINFNTEMENNIYKSNIKNIRYCDSYNSIRFLSPDGLHYNSITDQRILDFIVNRCLLYK